MKRYIRSSEDSLKFTPMNVRQVLKDHDIDTTLHIYELKAEAYRRYEYESASFYRRKFKCNGDYLAYFSMVLHKRPNVAAISDYFNGDFQEFIDFVEANPSVSSIEEYACSVWYGDGDDYIIYLKNMDTGNYLYQGDYEIEEDYEEDLEDEEE